MYIVSPFFTCNNCCYWNIAVVSEVVVVRLRPLSGVRPFLYTQVRFSICVEMSEPLWEVSCQKGSLQITNRRGRRYIVYCVVVVLVGVVVAVDAVNDNSELNEAAAVGKMISPPSYSNHKKRSSTTNSRYFLEMTASGKWPSSRPL